MNPYDKLVSELGEDGAKAEMRRRRSLANPNNHPGGSFNNPEFAREASLKAAKARKNNENKTPTNTEA